MSVSSFEQLLVRIDEVIKSGTPFDKILGADLNVLFKEASEFLFSRTATSFVGSASPVTDPGDDLTPRYYLTTTPGTYANFKDSSDNSIVVNAAEAVILIFDGASWKKELFPAVDLTSYASKLSVSEMSVLSVGKNLVNPLDPDYVLDKNFTTAGAIQTAASPWRITGYIPVKPLTYYTPSYKHNLVFYDINKIQISVQLSTRPNTYVQTPANAAYIRFAAAATNLQLEEGQTATAFEPFKYTVDSKNGQYVYAKHVDQPILDQIATDRASAITAAVTPLATKNALAQETVLSKGKNLVNPLDPDFTLLKNFSSGGAILDAASPWRITGYIPVKANTDYIPSYKHVLVYYDANKAQISVEPSTRTNQWVHTPSNAAFIRFAAAASTVQLEEGQVATAFEAFKFNISTKDGQPVYAKYVDQAILDSLAADRTVAIAAATAPLYTEINQQSTQLDQIAERDTPYTISMMNFAPGVGCPSNTTVAFPVTGAAGTKTLTASASDITAWGAPGSTFSVAVKHSDGTYRPYMCTALSATTITLDKALVANAAEVMAGWESVLGQHLSRYQSKALGDYTFAAVKRYSLRNQIIAMGNMPLAKQISGQGIKLFSTVDDSLMADLALIGGATLGGFTPGGGLTQVAQPSNASIKYSQMHQYHFLLQQGGAIGKGISWTVSLNKKAGYIELYIGTDVQGSGGAPFGSARVALELDGIVTFTQSVFGAVQRLDIPFTNAQTGVLKITTETTSDTAIRLGDVIWWQKRILSGNIFSSTDKIVFLGDSWTQFPAALKPGEVKPLRPDGSVADGMCFWPERFKELFAANGGNAANVLNCGRGGQTSVWGLYWFDTLVKAYNPTYVIIEFFTNDNSSSSNVAGHTSSSYDFDPVNPWASKLASAGGIFGSCTHTQWVQNIRAICDKAIAAGIKPIVIMPGWTDAAAQCQSHANMNELIIQGLK